MWPRIFRSPTTVSDLAVALLTAYHLAHPFIGPARWLLRLLWVGFLADEVGRVRNSAQSRFARYLFYLCFILPLRVCVVIILMPLMRLVFHPEFHRRVGRPKSQDGRPFREGVEISHRCYYGEDRREHLDEVTSIGESSSSSSFAVLFCHGGGFLLLESLVQLHQVTPLARALSVSVYSLTYPLAPERAYPDQIISVLKAMMWMRKERGIREVVLHGESAGTVLVTVVSVILSEERAFCDFMSHFSEDLLRNGVKPHASNATSREDDFPRVAGLVAWSAILDSGRFWNGRARLSGLLDLAMTFYYGREASDENFEEGPDRAFRSLSDAASVYVSSRNFPPTLLAVGKDDFFGLLHSNLEVQSLLLKQKGVKRVELLLLEGSHGIFGPPMVLPNWRRVAQPATERTVEFIREIMTEGRRSSSVSRRAGRDD